MSGTESWQRVLSVRKDNRIVDARMRLTLQALRVFTLAVGKLRPANRFVTFRADEFVKMLAVREDKKGISEELRLVAKELVGTPVSLPRNHRGDKKVQTWAETSLAASAELMPDGSFRMEFSELLAPYLFDVGDHYTPIDLETAMSLTSRHAFRLYEVVRSWEAFRDKQTGKHKGIRFTLDELYSLLGVEPHEYRLYGHFKSKVLNVACRQIEENSEMRFRRNKKDGYFDELKEGKKVAGVRFTLEQMELDDSKQAATPTKVPPPTPKLLPAPSLTLDLPLASVRLSEVLKEGWKEKLRTGEPAAVVTARITESKARARLEASRLALENLEKASLVHPNLLEMHRARLKADENALQTLLAYDQKSPNPEDDLRASS